MILPTLAELPPPNAEEMFTWLKVVVCLAGIYYLALRIVKEHKREPSVDADLRAVERAFDAKIAAAAEKHDEKMDEAVKHLDQRRSVSIAGVHEQLKRAELQLARVQQEAVTHTQQIAVLDQKLDRMPERIIALLPKKS